MFYMQVFYFLGELNDSLSYALGAGTLFDVSEDSDYVRSLLGKFFLSFLLHGKSYLNVPEINHELLLLNSEISSNLII